MSDYQPAGDASTDKLMSILSYLGILLLVPLLTGAYKRSEAVKFHLNQGVILALVGIIGGLILGTVGAVLPFLGFISWLWSVAILVLIVIGVLNAVNEKLAPLPVIGGYTILK
ncbi:MAG: hypothetical protein LBR58_09210 [Propionibacteriaceae bacterium]|jgi:uncharacterized membrane protein|nr:hypothetical protein [Propionibacteriaceae bacterium]